MQFSRFLTTVASLTSSRTPTFLSATRAIHIESRLATLGITLPPPPTPKANYALACRSGDMLYLSGHLPIKADGSGMLTGLVGEGGKSTDEGYAAARLCALNLIATLKNELGDLDEIDQIVKVFGIVNSSTCYKDQPLVMNGASDLFMEVFEKERGYHARSAIGVNTLPFDVSVEVEAIVRIKSKKV